jgi:hypothetical protein
VSIIEKALFWAFISIPISWIGLEVGFALSHGSLILFMPFVLSGFLISSALVNEGQSESLFAVVFYASQYFSYVIIIYLGIWLKRKWK